MKRILCWLGLLIAFPVQLGYAAESYPVRPITLIVPLTPGGAMDVVARIVANKMGEQLGTTIVVENRAGGGTLLGASAAARATPDGYTLFAAPSGTMTTNVALYRKLPYDPVADFTPVGVYTNVPFVLVVNPKLGIKSFTELVAYAKANPGKLTYASPGMGTAPHLAAELVKQTTGVEITHVPYRGSPIALSDTVAGHVDLTFADPATTPELIKQGKITALGVTSAERVPILSNVPTLAEAGLPGFTAMSWHALVAPIATPPEKVERLRQAFRVVMASSDVREKISKIGLIPVEMSDPLTYPPSSKASSRSGARWSRKSVSRNPKTNPTERC